MTASYGYSCTTYSIMHNTKRRHVALHYVLHHLHVTDAESADGGHSRVVVGADDVDVLGL
jgi:hypothetical protein